MAVATPRFDGAHLFAGHEDALVPGRLSRGAPPQGGSANQIELEELEARLAAAEARVQQQEAELEGARMTATSELEVARAEAAADLAGVHAASASELARAQERVAALEGRVADLEQELEFSNHGREDAMQQGERIRTLELQVSDAENNVYQARTDAEVAAAEWNAERAMWEAERSIFEQEKQQWEGLTETLENERAMWEQEREELAAQAKDEIADAAEGLRILVQRFDIPLFSRGSGLGVPVDALGRYLEKYNAQASDQVLASEVEKRSAIARELEEAKVELQALQMVSGFVLPQKANGMNDCFSIRAALPSHHFAWNPGLPHHSPLPTTRRVLSRYCSHFGPRCHPQKPERRD
jgi:chromosome segregation ATPase